MFVYLDSEAKREGTFFAKHIPLTTEAMALFKEVVFEKKKKDVTSTVQELVNRVRDGEDVDRCVWCRRERRCCCYPPPPPPPFL
jgi:hypothetical protein